MCLQFSQNLIEDIIVDLYCEEGKSIILLSLEFKMSIKKIEQVLIRNNIIDKNLEKINE